MDNKTTWLQIRVDSTIKKKLKTLAKANGIDMSGMVRFLIIRELKKPTTTKEAQN
jgi:antitoxin component of RelBE/YafQ-DinJ toxin-antitoxin module